MHGFLHLKKLRYAGYAPNIHFLDNECSTILQEAFEKYIDDYQFVPPHSHRRNAAKRAIQTWKNHFGAGLATCDPDFPISEWDRLCDQADLTLNLLRSSHRHPKLSAYACLYGNFDFNRSPIAPPGTKVVIHETPNQRSTYAPHGLDEFYIGPSMHHKVFISTTNGTRDALTVDWFPNIIPFPKISTDDYLRQTAEDMLVLLQHTDKSKMPTLTFGSNVTNAYIQIAQILRRATSRPAPLPSPAIIPAAEPRVVDTLPPVAEPRVVIQPPPIIPPPVQIPVPLPTPILPPVLPAPVPKKARAPIRKST